jgi:hypothetical protein
MWRRRSVSRRVPEPMTRLGGETGLLSGDKVSVDGVRGNKKNAVEAFGHELLDTTADDAYVARQHVEA